MSKLKGRFPQDERLIFLYESDSLLDLRFLENHVFTGYWVVFPLFHFISQRAWIFARNVVIPGVGTAY